jgi:hypothetical protein
MSDASLPKAPATGPSQPALDAATSIIAEALSRQTGERWVPQLSAEHLTGTARN